VAEPAASYDGRRARRDRNRTAVLDAVLEMFAEGVDPTPDGVAARSGVSPRSVYRYFEDRDVLVRAAIERRLETVAPLFELRTPPGGTARERAETIVEARLALYREVVDTARIVRQRAASSPALAAQLAASRRAMRQQVAEQFNGLVNDDALDAIDALLQFDAIDYLVETVSIERASSSLVDAVARLAGEVVETELSQSKARSG
jgi:AcrR family transcriptional regulator